MVLLQVITWFPYTLKFMTSQMTFIGTGINKIVLIDIQYQASPIKFLHKSTVQGHMLFDLP